VLLFLPPQPVRPKVAVSTAKTSSRIESRWPRRLPRLRMLPARGSSRRARASGAYFLVGLGCVGVASAAVVGTLMLTVTICVPEPAARIDGEKVAVAPEGSPEADKVTAVGKVVAGERGLKTNW